MYQRGDTWYEFLLKQFNPNNFDYGTWMEERRRVFLNESVRNPYFKYSLGTTIALLVLAMLYTKQWIDHRRAMWITAEMMAERAFVTRPTLSKVEKGDASVSMGIYATVLFVLGMTERLGELADVRHDELGLQLDEGRLPQRVRHKRR